MRIAIVSFKFASATNGGASTLIWELARGLKSRGHEVLILTATDEGMRSEVIEEIKVERRKFSFNNLFTKYDTSSSLAGSTFALLNYCSQLSMSLYDEVHEALRDFKPDVLEVPESYAVGFGFAVVPEYPLVVRCVCPAYLLAASGELGDFTESDIGLTAAYEVAVLGSASGLISISNSLATELSIKSGIPRSQFDIIRVPLSPPVECKYMPDKRQSGTDFPKLVYWGRVEPQKGVDVLIESLPHVAKVFPNFQLTFAGSVSNTPNGTGPYSEVLLNRLKELNLRDQVKFAGFLSTEDLDKLIEEADLCVFPSKYETACYTAIEAMARSKCVIATDVGGLPEYVEHMLSGYLVSPNSPKAMAEGIIRLCQDDSLRMSLVKQARSRVLALCDPSTVVEQTIAVYEKAITRFKEPERRANMAVRKISDLLDSALLGSVKAQPQRADLIAAWQRGLVDGREAAAAAGVSQFYASLRKIAKPSEKADAEATSERNSERN